jgi:hypothetical protein
MPVHVKDAFRALLDRLPDDCSIDVRIPGPVIETAAATDSEATRDRR